MPDIFLSYSRGDQATARQVADGFERAGFSVWWDQTLNAGEAYDEVTEKALLESKAVVVLWSRNSVASRWVRAEATQAERNRTLVPAMIEPCTRPIMFELTQTADLSNWNGDPNDKAWQAYVASVRRFVERDATGAAPATPVIPVRKRRLNATALAMVVAGLLVVGAGVWMLIRGGDKPAATPAVASAPDASVAVLPFRDMSPGKDQEYFADGITEEILNSLAGLRDLKVTGRTSSFAFKGKDVDLRSIGETLGVKNILEGSVRKDGNQLKITAQLNDATTGYHLWSKTYDRPLDDVFKVQEDIARSVAQAMEISLGVGELGALQGMTRNVDAYDAYLAAGAYGENTLEHLRAARTLLEKAVAHDGSFLYALLALSNNYSFSSVFSLPGDTREGWARKADDIIAQVQRQAPDSPAALIALADRDMNAWNWADSARRFERARSRSSKAGVEYPNKGLFLVVTGEFKEAISLLEPFKEQDPLNPFIALLLSEAYANSSDLQAAIAEQERGMLLNGMQAPIRTFALSNALATGDRSLINQRFELAAGLDNFSNSFFSLMKRHQDQPEAALAELRRRAAASKDQLELSNLAVWMAFFGAPEEALEIFRTHLGEFRAARRSAMLFDIWRPVMRDMRKLPGFKDLVREMGFVNYWREFGWPDLCKPVGADDFECT